MVPLGRLAQAEETTAGALFLASNESSYSSGIDLIADGGVRQLYTAEAADDKQLKPIQRLRLTNAPVNRR
jgi:hypothetical protein